MFKKSFVSLFFFANKFQVLALNGSKKKVSKIATVDLPEGLVDSGKVIDPDGLGKMLKIAWGKLRIKERSIGIVVPEFSTFSKVFNIPKLKTAELDEAVRWQAQELLPSQQAMVMDWRIIKKDDKGYKILAVAIEKDILDGYVSAAENAGLYPVVVEIPSISLVRLTETDLDAKLILFAQDQDVVIIIAEGESILGSSIQPVDDIDTIIKTSEKILSHFEDSKVKKVYIGGNFNPVLMDKIHASLKLPVEKLTKKIGRLAEEDSQKYLIPLSLQFKDPAEPFDFKTVNLLPLGLVDKYRSAKLKVQIWSLSLTITLFIWSCFLLTLGTYLFLSQMATDLTTRNALKMDASKENTEAINEIKTINGLAEKVLQVKAVSVLPQDLVNDIEAAKPDGVNIVEYSLDLEKGSLILDGVAVDRLTLIDFKQRLEENENFSTVDIPISSFEVETNLDFKLSFDYEPLKVKQSVKKGVRN